MAKLISLGLGVEGACSVGPVELVDKAASWEVVGVKHWCVLLCKETGFFPSGRVEAVGSGMRLEGIPKGLGFDQLIEFRSDDWVNE